MSAQDAIPASLTWAQRQHNLILNYQVPRAINPSVRLEENGRLLIFECSTKDPLTNAERAYRTELQLLHSVLPPAEKPRPLIRFVRLTLTKKKGGEWERLTATPHATVRHLISYDWDLDAVWPEDEESSEEEAPEEEDPMEASRSPRQSPKPQRQTPSPSNTKPTLWQRMKLRNWKPWEIAAWIVVVATVVGLMTLLILWALL